MFVSTVTSFTDQLPDDMFSVFSVSDQTTTSGAKSFSSSEIAVAATIPSLVALFLLLTLIVVIIVFVYKQQNNHNNSAEDRAYYSTIALPSPRDLKTEGNVAYEVIHGEPAKSSDLSSEVQKNVAYGVHVH